MTRALPVIRTSLIIFGLGLVYIGNLYSILLSLVGFLLILVGCYLWMVIKKRHWIFAAFGIIAPIGLIPLALLRDKNVKIINGGE